MGIGRSGHKADYLHKLFPGVAGEDIRCVHLTWLNKDEAELRNSIPACLVNCSLDWSSVALVFLTLADMEEYVNINAQYSSRVQGRPPAR